MNRAMAELEDYRRSHSEFEAVGEKMVAAWGAGLARSILL
jgi:serine/threonine-protein kinase HipA